MTISIRPRTPPIVVAFDHLPSDAEAAVYFSQRGVGSSVHRRVDGERELWEVPRLPLGCIAVFMLLMAATIAFLVWYFDSGNLEPSFAVPFGLAIFFTLWAIAWFIDDQIKSVNPAVVIDHARHELQVKDRDDPIAVSDVVELITWKLSPENLRKLELDSESNDRQTSVLVRRDDGFELIFLFDSGNVIDWKWKRTWPYVQRVYAEKQLADSLCVPWRQVGNVSVARDVRPPNRFMKRPEEITRK